MIYLSIIVCIVICIISFGLWKDPLSPPVIYSLLWGVMYLILICTYGTTVKFTTIYYAFCVSVISFFVGFFFVVQKRRSSVKRETRRLDIEMSGEFTIVVFLLMSIIAVYDFWEIYNLATGKYSTGNLWNDFLRVYRSEEVAENIILSYSMNAFHSLLFVSCAVFLLNNSKLNKKFFAWAVALSFPFLFGNSRSAIVMVLIALIFIICVVKNFENKKIFRWGICALIGVTGLVLVTALLKGKSYFENGWTKSEYLSMIFQSYFSSPMVAFCEWYQGGYQLTYGRTTFRMFFALMKILNPNLSIDGIVLDFTTVQGVSTNIYTGLYAYTKDFGVLFAYIMIGLLGAFHGELYKKSVLNKRINLFCIVMFSLMMSPLLQMYSGESHWLALSTWIQFAFWVFVFTYDGILVRVKRNVIAND